MSSKKDTSPIVAYFSLFKKEASFDSVKMVIVYALISGIANAAILAVANAAADSVIFGHLNIQYLLLFVLFFALFIMTKRYILHQTAVIVEETITKIRMRIVSKLRMTDLATLNQIGPSTIYTRITQDTNYLSQSAAQIVNASQSAIMIVFSLLYIAIMSFPSFLVIALTLPLCIFYFRLHMGSISSEIKEASQQERSFFEALNELIYGFKEIKLNRERNDALYEHTSELAERMQELKVSTMSKLNMTTIVASAIFYSLIGVTIFMVPMYSAASSSTLTHITAAILFIAGPMGSVVNALSVFSKAKVAIRNITTIEEKMDAAKDAPLKALAVDLKEFQSIELSGMYFEYYNSEKEATFKAGPLTPTIIRKGELIYIVGGNGSGKSTFLKLLVGLYRPIPSSIPIRINMGKGEVVEIGEREYPHYRELFSAIFTDFHLFDHLYGLAGKVHDSDVNQLIHKMGMAHKTSYEVGGFTKMDLSTGQRKRLALIVSLLEDKPVLIFDEVAADQDPGFREYFYKEFLYDLRNQGKTVIVVTHDTDFLELDERSRILKMKDGNFEQNLKEKEPLSFKWQT